LKPKSRLMHSARVADDPMVGPHYAIHDMGPRLRDTLVELMLSCPNSPATPQDIEHARRELRVATGGDVGRAEAALLFFEHAMRRPARPTPDDFPEDYVEGPPHAD